MPRKKKEEEVVEETTELNPTIKTTKVESRPAGESVRRTSVDTEVVDEGEEE